jgi:hypothetical protein
MKFERGDLVVLKKGSWKQDFVGKVGIVLNAVRHEPRFILYEVRVFGKKDTVRATARFFEHITKGNENAI